MLLKIFNKLTELYSTTAFIVVELLPLMSFKICITFEDCNASLDVSINSNS